ncbi:DUF1761 domain-containing protein [Cognatishimia sp.]|uniref:DUF1761 domain-containing protein n=1 Tax=Cognatishimia sp. TaxID=2211648 RepID=UPI003517BEE9
METEALNWTAILVGTVVAFFAGWAIYSPMLLGKTWAIGSRISPEPPEQMPWMAMVMQLAGLFLLALVIGMTAQTEALITAITAILAAAGMVMAQDAFSQKSTAATIIDGGYVVIAGALMIVCQGLF